ncbi:hypothetical protein HN031_13005 [Nocardioides sp. zg-1308]|uniref:Uncharacterized protein n=1 Tax=Nocardioides renjunii TaxID=3095075 RepID=A0ABU5KCN4_9ACTN|nr:MULTISPECIES: hypothetical protein [unclassified Nocardioides]MDZ5662728.1 hypothetical protein [Nocardioides sp. S-58]NPD05605.1 hypothetical protein [Nocardioides sp. zg-1308]WQQ23488.1 hypothetical protein SHK17_05765 [Nocardioides sp. S-34]
MSTEQSTADGIVARILPPGAARSGLALRTVLFLLPCAALAVALPEVPNLVVVALVVACSARWAGTPDHVAGAVALLLVAGWWAAHGVVDWRVLVVAVLLVAAHVVATVLAHGPVTLPVDAGLARLWTRRALLALVPMPVTWLAVRGLDADLAPPWLWTAAAVATAVLLAVTARFTQPEPE